MRISDWSSDVCSSDLFLDHWRQPDARRGLGLRAVFAGALLAFAQHAGRPVRGRLGLGPGLAGQAVAAGAARDRRGIGGAAPVEQVVARARHVADHLDRTLTGAARVAAADPWHAVVRSEEHTSELQSLMRHSYSVFCLK